MDGNSCFNEYLGMTDEEIRNIPHIDFESNEACFLFWKTPLTSEHILEDLYDIMGIKHEPIKKRLLKLRKIKGTPEHPNRYRCYKT